MRTEPLERDREVAESCVPFDDRTPVAAMPIDAGWLRTLADFDDHEQVEFCCDPESGLRSIIAVHSTVRGPSLGGCRVWPYANTREAVVDALRLARGMSYKHAVAETGNGGGKAVILADTHALRGENRQRVFEAFGRFVERLGGAYITAEDVGVGTSDMMAVAKHTRHVTGLPVEQGGSGDPSPVTAYGVYCGIQAALAYRAGREYDAEADLSGITVAVQGLGHVGQALCGYLHERGAKMKVADIREANVGQMVEAYGAEAVRPQEIYGAEADVFAPCAMGAVLNDRTVGQLAGRIVAGGANNQLATDAMAERVRQAGILYAPDYVINAGGIINISYEGPEYRLQTAMDHTRRIGRVLMEIFRRAEVEGRTTAAVADELARQRLVRSNVG